MNFSSSSLHTDFHYFNFNVHIFLLVETAGGILPEELPGPAPLPSGSEVEALTGADNDITMAAHTSAAGFNPTQATSQRLCV